MRIIYKQTLIALLTCLATLNVVAQSQCNNCPHAQDADYCFTDARFPGFCATFINNKPTFGFFEKENDKSPEIINLPNGYQTDALLSIANEQKKLTATEILFFAEAIKAWQKARNYIGLETTESGLGYKVIEQGSGSKPIKGKNVTVHYKGYLESGKVFDSSYDRGQPATFPIGIGRLIKGWDEGIPMFAEGSKILLVIPPELGYGSRGTGNIPANSTLFFEIEIIKAFQE